MAAFYFKFFNSGLVSNCPGDTRLVISYFNTGIIEFYRQHTKTYTAGTVANCTTT